MTDLLKTLLQGSRQGLTRSQVAARLGVNDRAARQAIENLVASGELPIICDRSTGEGHYRIAHEDEVELVNAELREHKARAMSSLRRMKGLHTAFLQRNHGAALFLEEPEVPA